MIAGLAFGALWFAVFLVGHVLILRTVAAAGRPRASSLMFLACLAGIPVSLWLRSAQAAASGLTHASHPTAIKEERRLRGFSFFMKSIKK